MRPPPTVSVSPAHTREFVLVTTQDEQKEAAHRLGISVSGMKSRVQRA
ncbi:hypothetical protein [Nonomuraea maritima]